MRGTHIPRSVFLIWESLKSYSHIRISDLMICKSIFRTKVYDWLLARTKYGQKVHISFQSSYGEKLRRNSPSILRTSSST